MSARKKIIISGAKYEQIFEVAEADFVETLQRVSLTVEIWNRERPKNQRQVITTEVWPPIK